MVKNSLSIPLLALVTACGISDDAPAPPSSGKAPDQAKVGGWRRLQKGVTKKITAIANSGKPRIVQRGASPVIIVKGEQLFIAGKPVALGQPLAIWRQAIPGTPRCAGVGDSACDWDELGITVISKCGTVHEFTVFFNMEPWLNLVKELPDGTPAPLIEDTRPKKPFPGYFEWDGYGIDANTRFWEIRASVDPERNVRCDMFTNSCGSTTAHFNDHAVIYLSLYQTVHENGRLGSFVIGQTAASFQRNGACIAGVPTQGKK